MRTFRFGLLLLTVCCLCLTASPTPFWTRQDFLNPQNQRPADWPRHRLPLTSPALDQYALLFEYAQTCHFLTVMQVSDSGTSDFGGMRENESDLWTTIQTDNTQEAIRVWSLYAQLTGDLETHRLNIARAWIYVLNHPAYNEEGEAGDDFYRVHNSGWGLVAEAKYRQVYGDAGYLWYADSCAHYIESHFLPFGGGSYPNLNPLDEGWAAGTLYDYGIEQSHPAAVNHAVAFGDSVKVWIEANPERLNNNEVWAMCGGTALWGVCRTVFAADTSAGQAWLPQYLPYMDTYAMPYGTTWNNSFNAWYAHAWHAAAAILHDPVCTQHAVLLVDTLLDADHPVDDDGGITAISTDPVTRDQSWVSCYLAYMGMMPLIDQAAPLDAAALGFLQPDLTQPIALGQPVPVSILVGNAGSQPFGNVTATVNIGGSFWAQGSASLSLVDVDTISMGLWTPATLGNVRLAVNLSPSVGPAGNDTTSILAHVLGWGSIQGYVWDLHSGLPLRATLQCFSNEFTSTSPLYTASTDSATGFYRVAVTEGGYRVVVVPQVPYTNREVAGVQVPQSGTITEDFPLIPAPVLLVDDDGGAAFEHYYTLPLAQAGYDTYVWDVAQLGTPANALSQFSGVIWFTGNVTDSVLNGAEQAALTAYLNNGGKLFLTGQNIAQGLVGQPFLADYLKASFVSPDGGAFQVLGVNGDPVTAGDTLLLGGSGGAGNQTSRDVIQPIAPGVTSMIYAGGTQLCAGIRVDSPYKLLYLSFGLEGASGMLGTTTRQEFLESVLNWFQIEAVPEPKLSPSTPRDFRILGLYPNPFNGDVQIALILPPSDGAHLLIYDVLGRPAADLPIYHSGGGEARITYHFPEHYASGVYYFVLKTRDSQIITPGYLVK